MTDLRKLIDAIEGGTLTEDHSLSNGHTLPMCASTWEAFSGSLDAAKAMHEALLPGWEWEVSGVGAAVFAGSELTGPCEIAVADNPARAWIIAILKAYEAQQ